MYLWHLLTRNKKELISKVYHIQQYHPTKKDYFSLIQKEKEKYRIVLSDEEISCMSKRQFRRIIDESVDRIAFSNLIDIASRQSKCKGILRGINIERITIQQDQRSTAVPSFPLYHSVNQYS